MSNRNILGAAGAVLIVNSAYLAAFATPSLFYYTNVGLHVVLGVVTLVLAVRWLRQRHARMPVSWMAAAALLGAGALLGGALVATGTTTRFRWLLLAHIAASTAGTLIALAIVAANALARRPRARLRPQYFF
jgi:RsiW-degrading membrane proteinase PrsW (M82 family)